MGCQIDRSLSCSSLGRLDLRDALSNGSTKFWAARPQIGEFGRAFTLQDAIRRAAAKALWNDPRRHRDLRLRNPSHAGLHGTLPNPVLDSLIDDPATVAGRE